LGEVHEAIVPFAKVRVLEQFLAKKFGPCDVVVAVVIVVGAGVVVVVVVVGSGVVVSYLQTAVQLNPFFVVLSLSVLKTTSK